MLKIFCWKKNEKMPDGTKAHYPTAIICLGDWGHMGHLITLSPHAAFKKELDEYIDSIHNELERERRKAHRWFDKQGTK
jgi:hypothetical protein